MIIKFNLESVAIQPEGNGRTIGGSRGGRDEYSGTSNRLVPSTAHSNCATTGAISDVGAVRRDCDRVKIGMQVEWSGNGNASVRIPQPDNIIP